MKQDLHNDGELLQIRVIRVSITDPDDQLTQIVIKVRPISDLIKVEASAEINILGTTS